MMYGPLNALMTFPSTYKDLMEDALSHVKWKERRGKERHLKTARWRLNGKKRVRKGKLLTGAGVLSGEVE